MKKGLMPGNLPRPAGSHDPDGVPGNSDDACPENVAEAYADLVYSLCQRLTRDEEEARELFQESFVKILKGLPSFEGRAALKTWICQVVINCDRNRRRWWSRFRRNLPSAAAEDTSSESEFPGIDPRDGSPGPERAAMSAEIRRRVETSLGELPPDQRIAVVLRDVEGMSYDEIAASTGTEIGTVKSRIGRARAALRRKLADLVDRPPLETSS